jgi:hypothetical protein
MSGGGDLTIFEIGFNELNAAKCENPPANVIYQKKGVQSFRDNEILAQNSNKIQNKKVGSKKGNKLAQ